MSKRRSLGYFVMMQLSNCLLVSVSPLILLIRLSIAQSPQGFALDVFTDTSCNEYTASIIMSADCVPLTVAVKSLRITNWSCADSSFVANSASQCGSLSSVYKNFFLPTTVCISLGVGLPILSIGFYCVGPLYSSATGTSLSTASASTSLSTSMASTAAPQPLSLSSSISSTGSSPTTISSTFSTQAISVSASQRVDSNTTPATSQTASSSSITASASSTPPSGYSQSDKIALGVGIGMGLPAIILALIGLFLLRAKN